MQQDDTGRTLSEDRKKRTSRMEEDYFKRMERLQLEKLARDTAQQSRDKS